MRVGACAGTTADCAELAASALATERLIVAQRDEERMIAVDLGGILLADVAAIVSEKAAGRDDARVGDEHHAASVTDAERRPHAGPLLAARAEFLNEHARK